MGRGPRRHRPTSAALVFALALLASGSGRAEAHKPDTPQDVYEREAGCAAIAAAAVDHEDMLSSISAEDRAKARDILRITQRRSRESGTAVGLTAEQVFARIAQGKQGILDRLDDTALSPEARQTDVQKLGRVLIACALLSAIEGKGAGH